MYSPIIISSQEGPSPQEPQIFTKPCQSPVEISNLERKAFTYLGEWKLLTENPGIAYRLGLIEMGDKILAVHYYLPVQGNGQVMTHKKLQQDLEYLRILIRNFDSHNAIVHGRDTVSVIVSNPPDWMESELEQFLSED
jgi:hypothetical protein